MSLPRHLRNFNLIVDGTGYSGRVEDVTLPDLTIQTESHRAGGMDSSVDVDMGMAQMELSASLADYDEAIFSGYGLLGNGVQITIRGAIQRQGEAAQPVVVKMLGNLKGRSPGTWTAGSKQTTKLTYTVRKYSESINGVEKVKIDVENMVRVINGTDQLASQRAAIGL